MKKYIISGLFLIAGLLTIQESSAQRRVDLTLGYSPFTYDFTAQGIGKGMGFNLGTHYYRRDTYFTHISVGMFTRKFKADPRLENVKSNTMYLRMGYSHLIGDTEMDDDFVMHFGWYMDFGRSKYSKIDEGKALGIGETPGISEMTAIYINLYGLNFGVEKTINQKFVAKGNFQANILSNLPSVNFTLGAAYKLY